MPKSRITKSAIFVGVIGLLMLLVSACSNHQKADNDKLSIVTTTNVYADIAKNIVGKYGTATAIIKNSATDPHDFEPTTNDAKKLATAKIIVANGLGYDSWMNKLASSVNKKPVLVGEDLMGLKKGDNPHIWYNLDMPTKYVDYLVKRLSKLDHKHAAYFKENGQKYLAKVNQIKKLAKSTAKSDKPVFVSEPVFDYALATAGYQIGDRDFEKAIENGTDPSPKTINKMNDEIKAKRIAFFVNNTQASSSTVKSFVKLAKENNIPVLNVRETIPNHTTYLSWMRENYQNLANIDKQQINTNLVSKGDAKLILDVNHLSMKFDTKTVFQDISFKLEEGSTTALLGPNGTGKTTLIRILMGMLTPTTGSYQFASDVKLGYVPQFRNIDSEYPLSIRAFIELNAPLFKTKKVKDQVNHQLSETHLTEIQNTRMGEASGGQKQRAYLAQALLDQPNMIILDEATASLDPVAKEELMGLIEHLNKEHKITVLFVTHDIPLAKKYMNNYLYLNKGTIRQGKMKDFKEDFE